MKRMQCKKFKMEECNMNTASASPIAGKRTRNTGIDCLKVIAILLVVISHVTQTLCEPSAYAASVDYIVPLENATTNLSYLLLTLLRHAGMLGNDIFFFCSAWYLLESTGASARKIAHMAADVWVVSVLFLIGKAIGGGGTKRPHWRGPDPELFKRELVPDDVHAVLCGPSASE